MISNYLDIFSRATCDILTQMGLNTVIPGKNFFPNLSESRHEVLIIVGLAHDIKGNVVFSMSETTAMALATTMLCGMSANGWDDLSQSAIREFGNMSAGTAVSTLAAEILADITPPTLVLGQCMSVMVSPKDVIAVKIDTSIGEIEVCLSMT